MPKRGISPKHLTFSAIARCRCGLGLAYGGQMDAWVCSGVLLDQFPASPEHDRFPFVFYEIKSEYQPSAGGRSTRPR